MHLGNTVRVLFFSYLILDYAVCYAYESVQLFVVCKIMHFYFTFGSWKHFCTNTPPCLTWELVEKWCLKCAIHDAGTFSRTHPFFNTGMWCIKAACTKQGMKMQSNLVRITLINAAPLL